MTYPQTPCFQSHSDTSRQAAEELTTESRDGTAILNWLSARGAEGGTIFEAADMLRATQDPNTQNGTASARIAKLLDQALISKTPATRINPASGRPGHVHVFGRWVDNLIPPAAQVAAAHAANVRGEVEAAEDRYDAHYASMALNGHGHVVPRMDGKLKCKSALFCKQCGQERAYLDMLTQRITDLRKIVPPVGRA